jgi:putative PIN family toxin of toxin-antitoxin system
MKVLIDTNILLSAALRDRAPERVVLHIARNDEWAWLVTPEIFNEYVDVLRRPKFALPVEVLDRWSELLNGSAVQISSPPATPDFPRDPKDAPFLAAALAAGADFLVTGDKDLLSLGTIGPTRVVTATEFAQEFQIR